MLCCRMSPSARQGAVAVQSVMSSIAIAQAYLVAGNVAVNVHSTAQRIGVPHLKREVRSVAIRAQAATKAVHDRSGDGRTLAAAISCNAVSGNLR